MQITANDTGMLADVCVTQDRDAHDLCVVVIKGTFDTDGDGTMTLAAEQHGLIYADEHYGDPESSCVPLIGIQVRKNKRPSLPPKSAQSVCQSRFEP